MKGELKAGGMALIINAAPYTHNIGKIVTLLMLVAPNERYEIDGRITRNATGENVWIVSGDNLVRRSRINGKEYGTWAQSAPRNLMPIDDDESDCFDAETMPKKEEIEA